MHRSGAKRIRIGNKMMEKTGVKIWLDSRLHSGGKHSVFIIYLSNSNLLEMPPWVFHYDNVQTIFGEYGIDGEEFNLFFDEMF